MTCISHVKSLSPTYAWSDPYYKMIASKIHSTKKHLIFFTAQEMYNLWSRYGMTMDYSRTINFSSHCMYDVSLQCHMGACCFATSSYATAVPHILQLSARPSSQKKMTDPLVRRYKRNSSTSWVFASMDIAWMLWTTFSRRHLWSHSTSHLSDTTMSREGLNFYGRLVFHGGLRTFDSLKKISLQNCINEYGYVRHMFMLHPFITDIVEVR